MRLRLVFRHSVLTTNTGSKPKRCHKLPNQVPICTEIVAFSRTPLYYIEQQDCWSYANTKDLGNKKNKFQLSRVLVIIGKKNIQQNRFFHSFSVRTTKNAIQESLYSEQKKSRSKVAKSTVQANTQLNFTFSAIAKTINKKRRKSAYFLP